MREVLDAVGDLKRYKEVVFCGYGEPLVRADLVIEAAEELKRQGAYVRVNTNGQSDLLNSYDVTPFFSGRVDAVCISLNAHDETTYLKICRPAFGSGAFQAVLEFASRCKVYVPRVILSVVEWPGVDVTACREIAFRLGVEFLLRRYTP